MEWRDEGLVIGVRRHGEHSAIVEAMTRAHGRHLGLVRGGRSTRLGAALQPGNSLGLVWRARLDEHLGAFAVEPLSSRAGRLMGSALALAGLALSRRAACGSCPNAIRTRVCIEALTLIADRLDDRCARAGACRAVRGAGPRRVRLPPRSQRCAATGDARRASSMSRRRSGRAVSADAGAPWRDRLLPLPAFLREGAGLDPMPSAQEVADGFRTTGFFLARDLFGARGEPLPDSRRAFLAAAAKAGGK